MVEQVGEASDHGKGFHGKKTAAGKKFDQGGLTAAHPTLPLGSEAKVTNLEATGDQWRYKLTIAAPTPKADIVLSKAAAKEIGDRQEKRRGVG